MIPVSKSDQNFSQEAQLADENTPKRAPTEFQQEETAETAEAERIARRLLMKHRKAFEELAK
jgi:antitoxin Phd